MEESDIQVYVMHSEPEIWPCWELLQSAVKTRKHNQCQKGI